MFIGNRCYSLVQYVMLVLQAITPLLLLAYIYIVPLESVFLSMVRLLVCHVRKFPLLNVGSQTISASASENKNPMRTLYLACNSLM